MPEFHESGDYTLSISVDGLTREYLLHIPEHWNCKDRLPLVLCFHGGGGSAKLAALGTGFSEKSDQAGFFVIYPEGVRPDPQRPATFLRNPPFWNVGAGIGYADRENIDDIGFIRALLKHINKRLPIDKTRVYATGFSNGASMAFQVATALPGQFAAIAPVSGHLWRRVPQLKEAISGIYIVGTADPLNPLNGGMVVSPWGKHERRPAISDSVETWANWLGCNNSPSIISEQFGIRRIRYGPGRDGAEFVFITIAETGHVWPGGPEILSERIAGKNTDKLDATSVIWDFFRQHQRTTM